MIEENADTSSALLLTKKPKNKSATLTAYYQKNKTKLLEYQKTYRAENRTRTVVRDRAKKHRRQAEAIDYLGGKCYNCSGVFPAIVYDFHHVNPQEKEFTLSEHWSDSKERIWAELDKCILLCANCHRLTHLEEKEEDDL